MSEMDFESVGARMLKLSRERAAALVAFLATQPQLRQCGKHPDETRRIDLETSQRATVGAGGIHTAAYTPCPRCQEDRKAAEHADHLRRSDVPSNLLHCTFGNWTPRDVAEAEHLRTVIAFAEDKRAGFLIMLGPVGTGKTHLAVAAMRGFRSSCLVKQSTLLQNLRDTYRDRNAVDPVDRCQGTGLLVLDEMGVSSGGKDELPMLHEILDHRHGEAKPTILTGNLGWEELKTVIGQRMADRMKESAFAILTFSGESHRKEARHRYFDQ
jgi:DNA replication protein DnaC